MVVETDRAPARNGKRVRAKTERDRERDRERRREKARDKQRIIGVDGEGEDRVCGECVGCDPPDPDAPRTCSACETKHTRSWWPNRRCPTCNASACLSPLHIYTYLAGVDEEGTLVAEAYNPDGLTHRQCCEMLLSLPKGALTFGFMFSYDVTKIIEQMPPSERFYLMRPKLRETKTCTCCKERFTRWVSKCPTCVKNECTECDHETFKKKMQPLVWGAHKYDFFNGSLTLSETYARGESANARNVKVWDCFRFFGCAFVDALRKWNIGSAAQVERISAMKNKRGAFDVEDPEAVKSYCREECHLLALMMRKLIDAHEAAEIPLKRYEGAGSTATALLKKNNVTSFKGPNLAKLEMAHKGLGYAIACAFTGGRFENASVGIIHDPVHSFDISSAYPYALSSLPCLQCGDWRFQEMITAEEIARADLALVRFHVKALSERERRKIAWCPLPFRSKKGSITYGTNFNGWAWAPEILAALRGWPDLVEIGGAWLFDKKCDHEPFGFLPPVYRERVRWGKEGAGEALKLGTNASYGKTAQSVGDDPPFQDWVWAGMTTASTRGQLLDAIASAHDPWSVIAVATDGIFATERLPLWHRRTFDEKKQKWSCNCTDCDPETFGAKPKDTGTLDLPKPLGGWEHKEIADGIFTGKPGLYWRLQSAEKLAGMSDVEKKALDKERLGELRARGVGRREVVSATALIEDAFTKWDRQDFEYGVTLKSRRFYGAKHSIHGYAFCARCKKGWTGVPEMRCPTLRCRSIGTSFDARFVKDDHGKEAYGRWAARSIKVSFDPFPKRERNIPKGGTSARLCVRDLDGADSAPYPVGALDPVTTPEGEAARDAKEFQLEQPDWNEMYGVADGVADE